MAQYDPLYSWLQHKSVNIVSVTFDQIEAILRCGLPEGKTPVVG
jgi:hypothetical protein